MCVALITVFKSWYPHFLKVSIFQEKYAGPPQCVVHWCPLGRVESISKIQLWSTAGQLHETISSCVMRINFPCQVYTYIHINQLYPLG